MDNNSEIVIYQSRDGLIHLDVQYADGTVWLTQQQIADLLACKFLLFPSIYQTYLRKGS